MLHHSIDGAHDFRDLCNYCYALSVVNVWGKCFKLPQLIHESFLTIDHSWKTFFWYLPNWTSTNLWCVVLYATYSTTHQRSVEVQFGRYQKNILQEWCRVKKLSRVSCGSLKCFPHTFTTNIHLYINPKGGLKKILSFEQACHFCSKQAVQKQWSLSQLSARSTFLCRKRGLRWWYRFCSRSHGRSSVPLLYTLRPL